jgi:nucleosome binding factor SPN SPT16 subunit
LIATVAGSIVAKKMQELAQQRLINIENLKARENSLKQIKTKKENAKLKIQERKQSADILRQEKLQTLEAKRQNILNDTSLSDEERQIQLAALNKEESKIQRDYKQEIKNLNAEEKLLDDEINAVNSEITANLIEQKEAGSGILSVFGSFIPIISTIVSLMSL